MFVPEFVSSLLVSVTDCQSQTGKGACPLVLRLGSASALKEGLVMANCSTNGCSVTLLAPPWHTWLRVVVESDRDNHTVTFNVSSQHTGVLSQHNTPGYCLLAQSLPPPPEGQLDLSIIQCCELLISLEIYKWECPPVVCCMMAGSPSSCCSLLGRLGSLTCPAYV